MNPAAGAFGLRRYAVLAAVLSLSYLWLVSAQPVFGLPGSNLDDEMFLSLARNLVMGKWLGAYSQYTLAKGCGYPLFIAAAFRLGVPLPLAEHGLYLASCWMCVRALRPVLHNDAWALGLFAALLWQPMSYWLDGPGGGNILRQNLYTPLTLLVFAGMAGCHTRRRAAAPVRAGWALLLGFSLSWFWITREESVWIVPGILLLAAATTIAGPRSEASWRSRLWPYLIAGAAAVGPVLSVCAINHRHYGWFGTVESRSPEFLEAYGALSRVRVEPPEDFVPVTRATRLAIYKVSPAFAELRPLLEGKVGGEFGGPDRRFNAGMWQWALRESVVASGHGTSAAAALDLYRRIGDEVNAACDSGLLPAGPRHDWFLPAWSASVTRRLREQFRPYLLHFVLFEGVNARAHRGNGTFQEQALFRDLTGWHLAPSDRAPGLATPAQKAYRDWRMGALQQIGSIVRWICAALVGLGMVAWIARLGSAVRRRRAPGYLWWISTAALACSACVFGIALLVHVTAWADWRPLRFMEAYPLLVLFGFGALAES